MASNVHDLRPKTPDSDLVGFIDLGHVEYHWSTTASTPIVLTSSAATRSGMNQGDHSSI